MPRHGLMICTTPGCPEYTEGGRCAQHRAEAWQRREGGKGYGGNRAWRQARAAVLARDPVCAICTVRPSTVADHYPDSRRELEAMGCPEPDALSRLRGLCKHCHAKETARHQPGGWNDRDW